jgi:hypothetical protein
VQCRKHRVLNEWMMSRTVRVALTFRAVYHLLLNFRNWAKSITDDCNKHNQTYKVLLSPTHDSGSSNIIL